MTALCICVMFCCNEGGRVIKDHARIKRQENVLESRLCDSPFRFTIRGDVGQIWLLPLLFFKAGNSEAAGFRPVIFIKLISYDMSGPGVIPFFLLHKQVQSATARTQPTMLEDCRRWKGEVILAQCYSIGCSLLRCAPC